ncbi:MULTISPECIES: phage tail protein [Escherichia]|uniref:Phage tail protein n=3 Tax=Escherichia TaxID=561 RepID=A0AAW5MQ38_9ESCH|nr:MULTISPECIES: phage tail protein [Escherichia]QLX44430.1 phage tail protein [Escherichia coli]MCR6675343.1 phage tail protein [Escherichia marmotae]QLW50463.1 phage tail protein [Escherichia marmotae]WFZ15456.1 phage tail protein [Escherichia marmotae]HAI8685987.1 phage tail protein [Escherichia coli]
MTTKHCSILTNRGKALEAASAAGGAPVVLDGFVVGDGNGNAVTPEAGQTALVREVYRGTISRLAVSPEQENQFIAYLVLPEGVGGFTVREAGLLTSDGELYAVGSCAAIEKPKNGVTATLQFRLAVAESAQVTLNVATGDGLFLRQDRNLSDVEDRDEAVENLGLKPTVDKAKNAVQRDGDTMSGDLTFENDSILAWIRNTDWAKIGFKNDSDSDTDSYLWFEAGDNGNEYFKWRSKSGTTTKDLMNLKWDALYVLVNAIINGEVVSKSANGFRIAYGNYGFFVRNDGSNTYFMLTNAGDSMGSYNGLRPFCINNATGAVTMGNGLTVSGGVNVSSGNITAGGGQVIPGNYSNFDARYKTKSEGVQDVRLGGYQQMGSTGSNLAPSGYVSVGGYCYGDWDNSADGWFIRPLQKLINGTWYNVASM